MAEFNGTKITEYKDGRDTATGTLARGSTFNNEFNRLYANDNYLKDKTDDLQAQITGLIDGAPEALNTLNELAAALNNDAGLATTLLAKIEASEQQNLVYNHDFRLFSNRSGTISSWYDYLHPDGWVYSDGGSDGKIGYDTDLKCCKFQTSSDGSGIRSLQQALHEFVNWRNLLLGKTVTLKAFIKGANATVRLTDGVTSQSFDLQNTGGIEEITLQLSVNPAATELTVYIESSTLSNIIQVYRVYANRGNYAIETLPCIVQGKIGEVKTYDATEIPPVGEFELNGIELPAGYTRLNSYINGKFGLGSNGRSKIRDGRGMFERQWPNGSSNAPDRATRTNRGDGVIGDRVGTRENYAMQRIKGEFNSLYLYNSEGHIVKSGALSGNNSVVATKIGTGDSSGSVINGINFDNANSISPNPAKTSDYETRVINDSVLKTIRWC